MAIEARLGQEMSFDGTEDVECNLSLNSRVGVQVIANGFELSDATITITSPIDSETVISDIEEGAVQAVVGEGFSMKKVTLGGLGAGDYSVLFIR